MKKWKHINFEQRKTISSSISHNFKLVEIAELLSLDPTSISKEVKRNRTPINYNSSLSNCPNLNRWPFVCSGCKNRYRNCIYIKYTYNASKANSLAQYNLINSRRGIDIDVDEFENLDSLIKNGVDDNKSIYQIKVENLDSIDKSITTLYRYINNGYLSTKRIDLPYAVKYKKRRYNKKYEYSNNFIDRTSHTYLDYLAFLHNNPGIKVWQLDFLGAIKTDSKAILSFVLPDVQFPLIEIINKPDSSKIVAYFDLLEEKLGVDNFSCLIPAILTDRDPCFSDIQGICFSKITGEERCKLFFCDPYVSNQKPKVENLNKQLRLFFPKKSSVDHYSKTDIKTINETLLNKPLRSLDSNTPKDAFLAIYGEHLFNNLF